MVAIFSCFHLSVETDLGNMLTLLALQITVYSSYESKNMYDII